MQVESEELLEEISCLHPEPDWDSLSNVFMHIHAIHLTWSKQGFLYFEMNNSDYLWLMYFKKNRGVSLTISMQIAETVITS